MRRLLASLLTIVAATGQQFAPGGGRSRDVVLPLGRYTAMAFADADGDGDQDCAANDPDSNAFVLLRQLGPRHWTVTSLLPAVVTALAWADLDGDGDRDLVVGGSRNPRAPLGVLRNDGAAFTWLGELPGVSGGSIQQLAIGDVDGDGDADVVVGLASLGGSTGPWLQLLRNNGSGALALAPGAIPPAGGFCRPVLFDRDGDGDLDLAQATNGPIGLFDNVGGTFVDISATLPAGAVGERIVAGDFDGDGRTDLAVTCFEAVDLLWNTGGALLRQAGTSIGNDFARAICAGDLDRDGDPDLAVQLQHRVDLWRNLGGRVFVRETLLQHSDAVATTSLAVGDTLARGTADLVCTWSDGLQQVAFGNAPQPVQDPLSTLPSIHADAAVAGDLDGDGRPEVVVCGSQQPVRLLHNDGRGRQTIVPVANADTQALYERLVDIDRDGDLDVLLASRGVVSSSLQTLLNSGGTLSVFTGPTVFAQVYDFAAGDVDGDLDVDVLLTDGPGVRLLRNVGGFALVDAGPLPGVQAGALVSHLVFADLDGDGDRDLVLDSPVGGMLPVFLNNGSGVFASAAGPPMSGIAQDLLAVDVDRDGDLDVVELDFAAAQPVLYRNVGGGALAVAAGAFPALSGTYLGGVRVGDLDGDGAPDLLLVGMPAVLLRNDGAGVFADTSSRLWSTAIADALFVDLDEDGDQDLLYWQQGEWRRALNGLRGAESLQVAHPGGQLVVQLRALPGAVVPGTFALPGIAFAAGPSLAFPGLAGSLLLPATATTVVGAVPLPAGLGTCTLALPPQFAPLGLDLVVQALVLAPGLLPGLTNVVDERILP